MMVRWDKTRTLGNNMEFVGRCQDETFNPKNIAPITKHGGGNIRICKYFSVKGRSSLVKVKGRFFKSGLLWNIGSQLESVC